MFLFISIFALILVAYSSYLFIGSYFICSNIYIKTICKVNTNKNSIVLSFDDGPDLIVTPLILNILKEKNVKAIFFLKGINAEKYPEIIKNIVEDGHIIGNHTFSHTTYLAFTNRKKYSLEIEQTNDLISCFTGQSPRFFRPPFGVLNPIIASVIKKYGMITIGWSIRSFDGGNCSADVILSKLKNKIHAGAIILFHDTNPVTVNVLKDFLDYLAQTDFKVERLDKLLNCDALSLSKC
ncbi:MAG: hypothetical protein A2046_08260 [Bacteroidetes bacterium GWA2_30_7]|nr:MAG: hypothetical protein A2046_08260 [Bacteroidetes bacterium GWA2_30_7]